MRELKTPELLAALREGNFNLYEYGEKKNWFCRLEPLSRWMAMGGGGGNFLNLFYLICLFYFRTEPAQINMFN